MRKIIFHLSASICIALASFCLLHADEPLLPAEEEPLARVFTIVQHIKEPFTRLETLLEVAAAYTECKEYDKAKDILADVVKEAARTQNAAFKSILLSGLADRYVMAGENEKALAMAQQIPFPDAQSDAMVKIVTSYTQQSQYEKALQAVKGIREPFAKALALCTVIKNARGRFPGVVDEAEAIMSHSSAEVRNLVRVISIGELAKFNSKPATHFSVSEDPFGRYKKLILLAERYIASQSYEQANRILKLATHIASDIKSPLTRNVGLSRIAINYAKIGEFARALELTQELDADYVKIWALSQIIINYNKAGKEQEGLALLVSIEAPQLKNRVCCSIAREYARTSEFKKALEAVEMINDRPVKLKAVLAVARNMQGKQDIPLETKELFSQVLSLLDDT